MSQVAQVCFSYRGSTADERDKAQGDEEIFGHVGRPRFLCDTAQRKGCIAFAHGVAEKDDEGEYAECGAERKLGAVYASDEQGEGAITSSLDEARGEKIRDTAEDETNAEDEVEPLERGEELGWRRAAFLVFPHLRVVKDGAHERVVESEEPDSEHSEPGDDIVEDRDQAQVLVVLVRGRPGKGRRDRVHGSRGDSRRLAAGLTTEFWRGLDPARRRTRGAERRGRPVAATEYS